MLMRSFTRREKILLLVLAVFLIVGLYFVLIHYPVESRLEEISDEMEDLEMQISTCQVVAERYRGMKSELEDIFALPEDEITVMPEYDNLQMLMIHFDRIFANTSRDLRFSATTDDGIVLRNVNFTFTAPNYAYAQSIIDKLTNTGYRCLLQSLSFLPTNGSVENDELRVSGVITFYEITD